MDRRNRIGAAVCVVAAVLVSASAGCASKKSTAAYSEPAPTTYSSYYEGGRGNYPDVYQPSEDNR